MTKFQNRTNQESIPNANQCPSKSLWRLLAAAAAAAAAADDDDDAASGTGLQVADAAVLVVDAAVVAVMYPLDDVTTALEAAGV